MFRFTRHFQNALQPLANSALDLNASERQAWLHELRAECPTVAREIERLLGPMLAAAEGDASVPTCTVVPGSPEHLSLRY